MSTRAGTACSASSSQHAAKKSIVTATSWTPIPKAQNHLVGRLAPATQQHPITGQRFRIRVLFAQLQFLQPRHVIFLRPAMVIGLSHPAPPDLIKETKRPAWMGPHQTDQAIPAGFFPDGVGIRTGDRRAWRVSTARPEA